jgi:hypothetical protein
VVIIFLGLKMWANQPLDDEVIKTPFVPAKLKLFG